MITVFIFLDAIANVQLDSMAKDASTSAAAKMEPSMNTAIHDRKMTTFQTTTVFLGVMRRAENATVSQVGRGFFAIHLVPLVDMDKIAKRNVTAKMERLVVISQVSTYRCWRAFTLF